MDGVRNLLDFLYVLFIAVGVLGVIALILSSIYLYQVKRDYPSSPGLRLLVWVFAGLSAVSGLLFLRGAIWLTLVLWLPLIMALLARSQEPASADKDDF